MVRKLLERTVSESKDDLYVVAVDYTNNANRTYLDKWVQYCPIVTANPDPKLTVPMAISPVSVSVDSVLAGRP